MNQTTLALASLLCMVVAQRRQDRVGDRDWHAGRVNGIRWACKFYLQINPGERADFGQACRIIVNSNKTSPNERNSR